MNRVRHQLVVCVVFLAFTARPGLGTSGLSLIGVDSVVGSSVSDMQTGQLLASASLGEDAETVTQLARVVAAEAGGNWYTSLEAKMAVAAAFLNKLRSDYPGQKPAFDLMRRFLYSDRPHYLSSLHDGNRHLFGRNAAWFRANAYSDCLEAARRALRGADPSQGATNWYDNSIAQPYSGSVIKVTRRIATSGPTLVFYVFR